MTMLLLKKLLSVFIVVVVIIVSFSSPQATTYVAAFSIPSSSSSQTLFVYRQHHAPPTTKSKITAFLSSNNNNNNNNNNNVSPKRRHRHRGSDGVMLFSNHAASLSQQRQHQFRQPNLSLLSRKEQQQQQQQQQQQLASSVALAASKSSSSEKDSNNDKGLTRSTLSSASSSSLSIPALTLYGTVAFLYWYWLVFGAVGQTSGWPFIPDWIPSTPTFPPTDAELQALLDDSYHFLYLSDIIIINPDSELQALLHDVAPAWRLAFFNTVEAWIVAWLPLLWNDRRRRWPRPVLLVYWAVGCVFLTNAFLAPYLFVTEFVNNSNDSNSNDNDSNNSDASTATTSISVPGKNRLVAGAFALFSSAVVLYALSTILVSNDNHTNHVIESLSSAFSSWWHDALLDRSVLAYGADLAILSIFQPLALRRVRQQDDDKDDDDDEKQPISDFIPFWGLIQWLLLEE